LGFVARASFFTSSENLSAPDAMEAKARLVVFAATVPNAAANRSPAAKALNATSSAALIESVEASLRRLVDSRGARSLGEALRRFAFSLAMTVHLQMVQTIFNVAGIPQEEV